MNKKQRNRKVVTQNKRNRLINRRYTSTIKTLSKLFTSKIKSLLTSNTTSEEVPTLKVETKKLVKNLYSMIDKAVKKGVIHKNTAARKKSKIGLMSKQVQY
jgi:small subunit ribosomal protein S20